MTSNTSTTLPSLGEDEKSFRKPKATDSQPSEESNESSPSITYDPPPASWFFNRGSTDNRNLAQEKSSSEKVFQEKNEDSFSSSQSKDCPSSGTNDRHRAPNQPNPNPDFGMVSDTDEDYDDHEGFNFIAVSKSLLMAGPSFDHVPKNEKEPLKVETEAYSSDASSEKHRGVLIVDGCGSVSETHSEDGAPVAGASTNPDASILTVPGSDVLPSDIDSISSGDGLLEQASQNQPDEDAPEDPDLENRPPLIHRFLKNLQQTRRLRLVSDASDENGGDRGSGVSVVRNDDEDISLAWTLNEIEDHFLGVPRKLFWRRWIIPISLFAFLFTTAFACHSFVASQHRQREAWEQQLQQEKEALTRILAEKESLRLEKEKLVLEAKFAVARAASLAREKRRLILERQEAEKAEKEHLRFLKEEERKQKERQRRREQPWRSSSTSEDDFGWFFGGSDEDRFGDRNDGSTSFTIADNCWVQAKADFSLGSCSSDTKDFFKDVWSSLLGDWEYYFDNPTRSDALERYSTGGSNGEMNDRMALPGGKQDMDYNNGYNRIGMGDDQPNRKGDSGDQGQNYQYEDDTYYPPQDPLQDLFSAIHTAGQSFVDKLTNMVTDEVEISKTAARDMEETISRQLLEASQTVSDAMEIAKEDMRDLSKETLSAIRTAVQKSSSGRDAKEEAKDPPHTAQQVTRKGLYEAAAAVTSLFESVIGEDIEK